MNIPTPESRLAPLIGGYVVTQAIYVAAKLKLADHLAGGPKTPAALAKAVGAVPDNVYRLLRALASLGIFAEQPDGKFQQTDMSELLRSDVPGSQWAMAVMSGEEHFLAYSQFLHTVKTGEIAFDKVLGMPVFDFLSTHPEQAAVFDLAMTSIHGCETDPMVAAYDFSEIKTIIDVGGGNGSVLSAILRANPHLNGILYDLEHVVERARPHLHAAGILDRCELAAGSFFESVPRGADAVVMRHIIHDWNDDQCRTILRNCANALPADGRVLVVETVVPPGNEPGFVKLLDLTMMALPGGKERTEAEYRTLFDSAGLTLHRIVNTPTYISVIEGRKK